MKLYLDKVFVSLKYLRQQDQQPVIFRDQKYSSSDIFRRSIFIGFHFCSNIQPLFVFRYSSLKFFNCYIDVGIIEFIGYGLTSFMSSLLIITSDTFLIVFIFIFDINFITIFQVFLMISPAFIILEEIYALTNCCFVDVLLF